MNYLFRLVVFSFSYTGAHNAINYHILCRYEPPVWNTKFEGISYPICLYKHWRTVDVDRFLRKLNIFLLFLITRPIKKKSKFRQDFYFSLRISSPIRQICVMKTRSLFSVFAKKNNKQTNKKKRSRSNEKC